MSGLEIGFWGIWPFYDISFLASGFPTRVLPLCKHLTVFSNILNLLSCHGANLNDQSDRLHYYSEEEVQIKNDVHVLTYSIFKDLYSAA